MDYDFLETNHKNLYPQLYKTKQNNVGFFSSYNDNMIRFWEMENAM